jgi:hypothetical protein
MKHIAVAFVALLTLGSAGVATAVPAESDDSALFSQLVEAVSVDSDGPSALDLIGDKSVAMVTSMAPRIDESQPSVKIAPPIVAGTVREDPPGTGIKPASSKEKKRGWLQRKLFGR